MTARLTRTLVSTTSNGTGDLLLNVPVEGHFSLADQFTSGNITTGDIVNYAIELPNSSGFEYGSAQVTKVGDVITLARAAGTLTQSTTGARLDVVLNTTRIFIGPPHEQMLLTEDLQANGGTIPTTDRDNSFESTDAAVNPGPSQELYRNSANPGALDWLGRWLFGGEDDADAKITYAEIRSRIVSAANGAASGALSFWTRVSGTLAERFVVGHGFYASGVTGGDPGVGRINVKGIEIDGVALANSTNILTYTAITDTALTEGDPVFLQDSGGNVRDWYGITADSSFAAQDINPAIDYMPSGNLAVLAYFSGATTLAFRTVTYADGEFTLGAVQTLAVTGTPQNLRIQCLAASATFVATWDDSAGDCDAVAGTVSGTTISLGSKTDISSGGSQEIGDLVSGGSTWVVMVTDGAANDDFFAMTVSGTVITVGAGLASAAADGTSANRCAGAYSTEDARWLFVWQAASSDHTYELLSVSGTTLTSQATSHVSGTVSGVGLHYVPGEDRFIFGQNQSDDFQMVDITTTTITPRAVQSSILSMIGNGGNVICPHADLVFLVDSANDIALIDPPSGTTATITADEMQYVDLPGQSLTVQNHQMTAADDSPEVIWTDVVSGTLYLKAVEVVPASILSDRIRLNNSERVIGIAQGTVSAAATATIGTHGVDDNQSGLTAGDRISIRNTDGSLKTFASGEVEIGRAVSATELRLSI